MKRATGIQICAGWLLLAPMAQAQPYQLGGSIGYGWYRDGTIFGPGATADAGIRNRFAAGAVFTDDLYEHISGEVRYLYQDGHPFLSSGGVKVDMQGQSHAVTYQLLFHLKPQASRWRPYIAAGGGIKGYVVAGPAPVPQPLPKLASLVTQDEWKLVIPVGGGVQYRLAQHVVLRFDLIDYLTAFPKQQIAPAPNNTARGILQQLTPLFGIAYSF
jgi:hypothetical protein